jgi:hypothetical protein
MLSSLLEITLHVAASHKAIIFKKLNPGMSTENRHDDDECKEINPRTV